MKTIICEKSPRIIKNKKKLEEILNIKIIYNGKEVTIDGTAEEEFEATKVIDALNFGFSYSSAISIKKEEKLFEIINIKDYTNKSNLEIIRGRIIGKGGKALKTLSQLTNCDLELKNNEIGIIGEPEDLERAIKALIEIIQGSKHSNVYKGLEKNQPKPIVDLGLKNEKELVTMKEFEKRLKEKK
jgi:ribosomal RNA assembly protein